MMFIHLLAGGRGVCHRGHGGRCRWARSSDSLVLILQDIVGMRLYSAIAPALAVILPLVGRFGCRYSLLEIKASKEEDSALQLYQWHDHRYGGLGDGCHLRRAGARGYDGPPPRSLIRVPSQRSGLTTALCLLFDTPTPMRSASTTFVTRSAAGALVLVAATAASLLCAVTLL